MPWATYNGTDFATYTTTAPAGILPATGNITSAYTGTIGAGNNVKLTANGTVSRSVSINSLNIPAGDTLYINPGVTLTVASGSGGGVFLGNGAAILGGGTLAFPGTNQGLIYANSGSTATIASGITINGADGVAYGGGGTINMYGQLSDVSPSGSETQVLTVTGTPTGGTITLAVWRSQFGDHLHDHFQQPANQRCERPKCDAYGRPGQLYGDRQRYGDFDCILGALANQNLPPLGVINGLTGGTGPTISVGQVDTLTFPSGVASIAGSFQLVFNGQTTENIYGTTSETLTSNINYNSLTAGELTSTLGTTTIGPFATPGANTATFAANIQAALNQAFGVGNVTVTNTSADGADLHLRRCAGHGRHSVDLGGCHRHGRQHPHRGSQFHGLELGGHGGHADGRDSECLEQLTVGPEQHESSPSATTIDIVLTGGSCGGHRVELHDRGWQHLRRHQRGNDHLGDHHRRFRTGGESDPLNGGVLNLGTPTAGHQRRESERRHARCRGGDDDPQRPGLEQQHRHAGQRQ